MYLNTSKPTTLSYHPLRYYGLDFMENRTHWYNFVGNSSKLKPYIELNAESILSGVYTIEFVSLKFAREITLYAEIGMVITVISGYKLANLNTILYSIYSLFIFLFFFDLCMVYLRYFHILYLYKLNIKRFLYQIKNFKINLYIKIYFNYILYTFYF